MPVPTIAALAEALDASTELEQATGVLAAAGAPAAGLTLGAGDRLLLGLHRWFTGRDLEIVVPCPDCGETCEVTLGPDAVPPPAAAVPGAPVRPPTYGDLAGLPAGEPGVAELRRRCTVDVDVAVTAEDVAAVDDSLSGPLLFECPECGAHLQTAVDVQPLALRGLLGVVARYDVEVHRIATAYHWDLATIEALPDRRRARLARLVEDGR
jgi:predicted RNA-binding Zn-ribbon protein involved in translation (DUF1610 family)